jgi:hypothetical protein
MMFLGGSYHDRDNPANSVEPHHGKLIVWMTLVCNWKDGDSGRAAAGGLRTTGDDLMMMMMMMNIFYGGPGTKCTENQIVTRKEDRLIRNTTVATMTADGRQSNKSAKDKNKNNPTDTKLRPQHDNATLVAAFTMKMMMTRTRTNTEDDDDDTKKTTMMIIVCFLERLATCFGDRNWRFRQLWQNW